MKMEEELIETLIVLRAEEILCKNDYGRKEYIVALIEHIELLLEHRKNDNKNKNKK